jgi:hypothetical protein
MTHTEYFIRDANGEMKPSKIVTEREREMCRLAPGSLTAAIVNFRIAELKFCRELKKEISRTIKLLTKN